MPVKESKLSRNLRQTQKRRYLAILFDLDGTIIKSAYQAREAKIALLSRLKELGIDARSISLDDTTMVMLSKANAQIKKDKHVSFEEGQKAMNEVLGRFDIQALSQSKPIHNAKSILRSLRKRGLKLGLVTNSGRPGIRMALKKFRLENYFDVVVARDDVKRIKPCGEGIMKAVSFLGCKRSQAMYVGDSWIDVRAAKNADVTAVAMTGGISQTERLRREFPDVTINALDELLDIV